MKEMNISDKEYPEKQIIGMISDAKNKLESPEAFRRKHEYHYRNRKIAEVYETYQTRLKANSAMDFDDLIMKTVELFRRFPEVS